MATQKLYKESDVKAIADSIRDVLGTARTYKISEMALEISSKMKKKDSYTITTTVTNGTYTGDTEIYEGSTATVTIVPTATYSLPDSITVSGATYTWDKTTGVVALSNPTANVTISAACVAPVSPTDPESWGTGANADKWTQGFFDGVQTMSDTELAALIGKTRQVEVNGVKHEVRVIGYNHDDLATGTGKAKLTFQFTKILGDANGYSLATFWKNTNDTSTANYDFINSDIRKALDGQGTGTANWFVKGETTWNSSYAGKSVLSMLPTLVQSNLKEVSKPIATTSTYSVTSYNTKVFVPSYREMTAASSSYAKEEGTTYAYWAAHDNNTDRIIKQVKGSTGALTNYTTVTSGAYTGTKYSYAGYNSSTSGEGGIYWLRSPYTSNTNYAWRVLNTGRVYYDSGVCNFAFGVSPCFCL